MQDAQRAPPFGRTELTFCSSCEGFHEGCCMGCHWGPCNSCCQASSCCRVANSVPDCTSCSHPC